MIIRGLYLDSFLFETILVKNLTTFVSSGQANCDIKTQIKPSKLAIKMTNLITLRENEMKDKNDVIDLITLNTPEYFAVEEED